MKRMLLSSLVVVSGVLLAGTSGCGPPPVKDVLEWGELPPLPDPVGFAGAFAGVSDDALIVAGGANFPVGRPWDGAAKVWHDGIFVLTHPRGKWRTAVGKLPQPLAYGVSLTAGNGVVCAGGGDAQTHSAACFMLKWDGTKVTTQPLPPLPRPAAFFCGAALGQVVYLAGGREKPDSPGTLKTFWALDLSKDPKERKWQELPPWPGRGRMLAVAAAQDGHFFLFSGVDLVPGKDGKPKRTYLRDAYRFTPGFGWRRMADLPHPVAGAPTPALGWLEKSMLVLGGDDGLHSFRVAALKDHHPGFTPEILLYCNAKNTWTKSGRMLKAPGPNPARTPNAGLWPPVTTPTVPWRGRIVIPSGEVRPGVRTPRVIWGWPFREAPETCPWNVVCWVPPIHRMHWPPWMPFAWYWHDPGCCP